MLNKYLVISIFIIVSASFMHTAYATDKVIVSANVTAIEKYLSFIGDKPCHEIDNFDDPDASFRAVVELVFICQALYFSKSNLSMELMIAPNYKRALILSESGDADMPSETIWEDEIDTEKYFSTIPIVRSGEMVLGLYTNPTNAKLLAIDNYHQIENFSAVVQKTWLYDFECLNYMNLQALYSTSRIDSMFKMVYYYRADFLLWTFSNLPDLSQSQHNITLIPVLNFKISIPHARRFIISKNAKNSSVIYDAIQKGLLILREKGIITKAFEQSGFFSRYIDGWEEIPCYQ